MARYRLRFLLQQFDLPKGVTVLGRSVDCHVTVDDPLVSRQHAKITVDESGCFIEDLSSRNGVRVNGIPVRARTELWHDDRIRIGSQDLSIARIDGEVDPDAIPTGVLRACPACKTLFPRDRSMCPLCRESSDPSTLTGQHDAEPGWGLTLLREMLEANVGRGRFEECGRILQRASSLLEQLQRGHQPVDASVVTQLSLLAVKVSLCTESPTWVEWVAALYGKMMTIPPPEVVEALAQGLVSFPREVGAALDTLVEHLRRDAPLTDATASASMLRLERLRRRARPDLAVARPSSPPPPAPSQKDD